MTTIFNNNCEPIIELGRYHRSTIKICPFSKIVMIGGFGNLSGDIDFWELDNYTHLGKTERSTCASEIEWASDGLTVFTSVIWEKLKEDNKIRIFQAGKGEITALEDL